MDAKIFKKKLFSFYSSWRQHKNDLWGNAEVVVIGTPPPSTSTTTGCYPMSSFFFFWLFNHELPNTTAIFTHTAVYFLSTKNKVPILQPFIAPTMEVIDGQAYLLEREEKEDGFEVMDGILLGMKLACKNRGESGDAAPLVVGCLSGESPNSRLLSLSDGGNARKPADCRVTAVNEGLLNLTKVINHANQKRRMSKKVGIKGVLESHGKGDSSRIRDCNDEEKIQMLMLPDEFEQMISSSSENSQKIPAKAQSTIDEGKLENVVEEDDRKSKSSHSKSSDFSSEYCMVSREEEEWILV